MSHFVYVLFSASFKKIYIGYTSDLKKRIESHKLGIGLGNYSIMRSSLKRKMLFFERSN